jgi:hypothetical protein
MYVVKNSTGKETKRRNGIMTLVKAAGETFPNRDPTNIDIANGGVITPIPTLTTIIAPR